MENRDTQQSEIRRNPQSGYTLIEFVIVAAILMVVGAMAVYQMQPAWQEFQAAAAMSQVKSALRQARETAIGERRTIVVEFVAAANSTSCLPTGGIHNCIELFQVVVSGTPLTAVTSANPYLTLPVGNNVQFVTFAGETDTPDAFGIPAVPSGTDFAGAVGNMQFQSDGTFTDSTGTPISGTVFLGVANKAATECAVTILGTTGRVRSYRGNGSSPTGWTQ